MSPRRRGRRAPGLWLHPHVLLRNHHFFHHLSRWASTVETGLDAGESRVGIPSEAALQPNFPRPGDNQKFAGIALFAAPADPDRILVTGPRTPVEPAVQALDREAFLRQQHAPLGDRDPREAQRR